MKSDDILKCGYASIVAAIDKAPNTWLPGFLIHVVEVATKRGDIFVDGGAEELVRRAEARARSDMEPDE